MKAVLLAAHLFLATNIKQIVAQTVSFDNSKTWQGISLLDSDNATVLRELNGKTGWSWIGGGDTKFLSFQFSLELEQKT